MPLTNKDIGRIAHVFGDSCKLRHDLIVSTVLIEVDKRIAMVLKAVGETTEVVRKNTQTLYGPNGDNGMLGTQKEHDKLITEIKSDADALKKIVSGPNGNTGDHEDLQVLKTQRNYVWAWIVGVPVLISVISWVIIYLRSRP